MNYTTAQLYESHSHMQRLAPLNPRLRVAADALRMVLAARLVAEQPRPLKPRPWPATQLSGDPSVAPTQWHGGYAPTQVATRMEEQ